jgi:cell division protein FtsB
MQYLSGIIIRLGGACLLLAMLAVSGVAQESRQGRAANLRAQLAEVQAKQTELQTRLQQIEEEIKPESIERSLAGIGSTHPEDLREQRRRQLETEKKGLQSQLDTLAASRARLETAIATADAINYQTGGPALGVEPSQTTKASIVKKKPNRPARRRVRRAVRKQH